MHLFPQNTSTVATSADVDWGLARPPRVAIVHDWLVTYAGSERVLERLIGLFPQADVYALVDFLPQHERGFLAGRPVRTSFLQKVPFARRCYSKLLPLMPLAIEQFDLSGYDIVLSSSHCVAKGVLTGPTTLHVSYVHTAMRYAWDLQHEYLEGANLARGLRSLAARWMLHKLRIWDVRSSYGVDAMVANSRFIARRIRKTYGRKARVIYPPVDVENFVPGGAKEDYYVTASRLVPYKRIDVLIDAFARLPERRLVVIGEGPQAGALKARAGSNVTFLGLQDQDSLVRHMQRAKAFLFAAQEDFGIVLVEAQACGTPVIALGKGGALETVRGPEHAQPTGLFFESPTPACVAEAVHRFESSARLFTPAACRANAERFDSSVFDRRLLALVERRWQALRRTPRRPTQNFPSRHAA